MSFFMCSFAENAALGVAAITAAPVEVDASTDKECVGAFKRYVTGLGGRDSSKIVTRGEVGQAKQ